MKFQDGPQISEQVLSRKILRLAPTRFLVIKGQRMMTAGGCCCFLLQTLMRLLLSTFPSSAHLRAYNVLLQSSAARQLFRFRSALSSFGLSHCNTLPTDDFLRSLLFSPCWEYMCAHTCKQKRLKSAESTLIFKSLYCRKIIFGFRFFTMFFGFFTYFF